jgi:hypothetical protein
MNPKLAKIQDKTIVRQRNVPNLAKNVSVQKKSGILATTLVSIPLKTLTPMSP